MRISLRYERKAFAGGAKFVAGIDEAGRGPLAGPVVAAAVMLPCPFKHKVLNDSKQLTPEIREEIYGELTANPNIRWAVGISDVECIDRFNILRACWRAMQLAIDGLLEPAPDHVLIDGLRVRAIRTPQTAIVDGDCKSYSIAAASVIAKVTRDRLMLRLHESYPQYNFAQHKGYATPEHFAAIEQHGPCIVHRKSFYPMRVDWDALQQELSVVRGFPAAPVVRGSPDPAQSADLRVVRGSPDPAQSADRRSPVSP